MWKKVLVIHIPFALTKDTSLSPLSLVCLPSPYGPTTPLTLSLTDALKSPIMHHYQCIAIAHHTCSQGLSRKGLFSSVQSWSVGAYAITINNGPTCVRNSAASQDDTV